MYEGYEYIEKISDGDDVDDGSQRVFQCITYSVSVEMEFFILFRRRLLKKLESLTNHLSFDSEDLQVTGRSVWAKAVEQMMVGEFSITATT